MLSRLTPSFDSSNMLAREVRKGEQALVHFVQDALVAKRRNLTKTGIAPCKSDRKPCELLH